MATTKPNGSDDGVPATAEGEKHDATHLERVTTADHSPTEKQDEAERLRTAGVDSPLIGFIAALLRLT